MNVGDVYIVPLNEENGITPKNGDSVRNKFFIVLGFDNEGYVYGGVVMNSKVNLKMREEVIIYQMPIKCSNYPFLRYDSYVNCASIIIANPNKLVKKVGKMLDEDLELIIDAVKESPTINKKMLIRFGL